MIYGNFADGVFTAAAFDVDTANDALVTLADADNIDGLTNTWYMLFNDLTAALTGDNFIA